MATSQSTIQFKMMFNNQAFHKDSSYTNSAGETVQIHRFMFYTTKWKLITASNDTINLSNEHFLINIEKEQSMVLPFPKLANATKLIFDIGVDSILNTTGIQTGILDPALGMFWTWRTGYIMAKLHGVSPQAKTAGNRFSYEVGGFQSPFNSVRTIELELPTQHQKSKPLIIKTDLAKWFSGKHIIQIGTTPNCHNAGKLAMQLADNYSSMFSMAINN
ncbi:MAG: MbnP family protein [Sediminibacterium sp.]